MLRQALCWGNRGNEKGFFRGSNRLQLVGHSLKQVLQNRINGTKDSRVLNKSDSSSYPARIIN